MKRLMLIILAALWWWPPSAAGAQEADSAGSAGGAGGIAGPAVFLLAVPQSGFLAEWGQKARQGAELALNTMGGGFRLEVLDESRPGALDEIDLGSVALVLGYFTESRFAADAPRYLYLKKPMILPYLTNEEAVGRGPGLFFRLLPTAGEQGRQLALEILKMRSRPGRLLLITGADPAQDALARALGETLARPEVPALKPLDPKALVVTISLAQALEPEGLTRFGRQRPDLVVLALDRAEALELAPRLQAGGYEKTPLWGAVALGFRDVGAGFARLNLTLRLWLPTVNLADRDNPAARDFVQQFIEAYKAYPTWISALAYDGLGMAIKAAGSGADQGLVEFLAGRVHQGLASYDLGPSGGGLTALGPLPVSPANLGYLP